MPYGRVRIVTGKYWAETVTTGNWFTVPARWFFRVFGDELKRWSREESSQAHRRVCIFFPVVAYCQRQSACGARTTFDSVIDITGLSSGVLGDFFNMQVAPSSL